jgi:hypothetical protein
MPSLYILRGPNEGNMIPVTGERFDIGRNADSDLVLSINSASRKHAEILRGDGRWFIEDRQSRNHTFVNNQVINTRTALKNNDRIRICDFIAAFHERTLTEADWQSGGEAVLMLQWVGYKASDRKRRLFAVACCRHFWHQLTHPGLQAAVEVAERYADGLAAEEERQRAEADIKEVRAGFLPALQSIFAAAAAWALASSVPCSGGIIECILGLLGEETRQAGAAVYCPLLPEVFESPFRASAINPQWRTRDVMVLAASAYEEREPHGGALDRAHVSVLGDALEDAGCSDQAILDHLRGPGPMYAAAGCWIG